MLIKIYGIIRRFYYLTAFLIAIGCFLGYFFGSWEYINHNAYKGNNTYEIPEIGIVKFPNEMNHQQIILAIKTYLEFKNISSIVYEDEARIRVLWTAIFVFPVFFIFHMICRWVLWGKLK